MGELILAGSATPAIFCRSGSSGSRAQLGCRAVASTARPDLFAGQGVQLLELHVNAAASGIDSNAALCGGNADDHTGLI